MGWLRSGGAAALQPTAAAALWAGCAVVAYETAEEGAAALYRDGDEVHAAGGVVMAYAPPVHRRAGFAGVGLVLGILLFGHKRLALVSWSTSGLALVFLFTSG